MHIMMRHMESIFVTKIKPGRTPPSNLRRHFAGYVCNRLRIDGISAIRIGTLSENGPKETPFFSGTLLYKKAVKDWDYDILDEENLAVDYSDRIVHHSIELNFTIFPTLNVVTFSNKTHALDVGMRVLSKILFDDNDCLDKVSFYPTQIYEAKKKAEFSNVWYNGVHGQGKIRNTNQHGDDIDSDPEFLDKEGRYGIGVEVDIGNSPVKISVYSTGSIVFLGSTRSFRAKALLIYKLLERFKKHSSL